MKFGIPATNLATKATASRSPRYHRGHDHAPEQTGRIRQAPWKAEVTEGTEGVDQTVIDNWYNEVYEPSGDLNLSPIHLPSGNETM